MLAWSELFFGFWGMDFTSVADLIEPCPRESHLISVGEVLGDVERKAAACRGRAGCTLKDLDDLEDAVGCGLLVHRNGKLARATSMGGAALETKEDRLVDRDLVHRGDAVGGRVVGRCLAREVGAISLERGVVKVGDVERNRRGHLHVGVRNAAEGEADGEKTREAEAGCHVGGGRGCVGRCVCCWNRFCWCGGVEEKIRPANQNRFYERKSVL
jgi:hypothetical protein